MELQLGDLPHGGSWMRLRSQFWWPLGESFETSATLKSSSFCVFVSQGALGRPVVLDQWVAEGVDQEKHQSLNE